MSYNDTLTQIAQMSFTFNHIIVVTIVQRTPNMANNYKDLKEKFFFMMTFAAGINQGGNRTYDFKNGKITQKFATREIAGLAEILHQCAMGNDMNVLPYAKFSKSANNSKQLAVWTSVKQQQISGEQRNVKTINLTFSMDKTKHSVTLTPDLAFGMSKVLNTMYEKAIQMEMDCFVGQPFQIDNRFHDEPVNPEYPNQFNPNQQPTVQFNPNQQGQMPFNQQGQMPFNQQGQVPFNQQGQVPFNQQGRNPYKPGQR